MYNDALITAPDAARHFGITRQAIHYWHTAGHLTATRRNSKGQPLFRLIDLMHAESATRRSPRAQRHPNTTPTFA